MCVKEIDLWMVKNRLKLNGNKTELLIIKSRNDLFPIIENIEVSNSTIQPSTSAYNIGFFHLRKIAIIKDYLSTSDIRTLVHAFLHLKLIIITLCYMDCLNIIENYENKSQSTNMVDRIVRQLARANENLTGNVLKTILTISKIKEV